jgi:hypothetical protein
MPTLIFMAKVVPIIACLVAPLALMALASCASGGAGIGGVIPTWAGGMPDNVPPRPGTPEYEEYRKRLEGRSKIDAEQQQDSKESDAAN